MSYAIKFMALATAALASYGPVSHAQNAPERNVRLGHGIAAEHPWAWPP
jgi:hypothetical protein